MLFEVNWKLSRMNKSVLLLLSSMFLLSACGNSDQVRTEEYEFADGLKLLDVPPNLTRPNKNLVMEIPQPSLKACEKLMEANRHYQVEKAKKDKQEAAAKALKANQEDE